MIIPSGRAGTCLAKSRLICSFCVVVATIIRPSIPAHYTRFHKAAAEDVVQDVFVRFAGLARTFRLTGSLKGYLATCVANGSASSSASPSPKKRGS
ncbi:MAG: sigma-70 family RNA polymerase sigma factor [Planctomycetes bacterium]|nr:sigma-70 family RNA polymerase sigma factor [Planctomycetota bacterium]